MNTIQSIGYPIFFNDSLTELANFVRQGNYSHFFILTDENTGPALPAPGQRKIRRPRQLRPDRDKRRRGKQGY